MHDWHIRLYKKSVTKQLKFRNLRALAGDCAGKRCLDLGADNGVISYLFRQGGGDWASADIDPRTVELIRGLVGGDVRRIANDRLPYADSEFDTVVIVDMLEHLADDRGFLLDLARGLKEDGTLVVNVPRRKGFSLVRRLRHLLGLTDDQHGHLRPGYTRGELAALLAGSGYAVERCVTYSRFFTELVDAMVSFAAHALSGEGEGSKGTLVSGADLSRHRKKFAFFSLLYPFMWLLSRLDWLLFFMPGDKLAVRARRLPAAEAAAALEPPDIETASDEYAGRFSGAVGEYFLERQSGIILGLLRPRPGAMVLDVGGGHAQTAVPLHAAGFGVTVTGSSAACLRRLERFMEPGAYRFCQCPLLPLPFADRSFDVVIAIRLLAHAPQWRLQVAELCRVARSTVIVDYPDLRSVNALSERFFGMKKRIEKNTRPFQCFRRGDVLREFRAHGFVAPARRPEFFIPMAVHRALGRARLSRALEAACRGLGLTRLFGSPVLLRAEAAGGKEPAP
jgi:2-polyprenyl-3-methyl-5-hydroxy-6-metoxy-1,4-benzoquinol methylase